MTLHEEIVEILELANKPLTTSEIAQSVNKRKKYIKKDGSNVTAFQIHGRTKNYPKLFSRSGSTVSLINNENKNKKVISINSVKNYKTVVNSVINNELNFAQYNVTKIEFLKNYNFVKLNTLGTLLKKGLSSNSDLDSCGIYAITMPENYSFEIISAEETKLKNNVVKPWTTEKLKNKWVNNVDILYYGLAGARSQRSLRERLNDLLDHGNGKTTSSGPHKGGEILWQLKGYERFDLWILQTGNPPSPRNHEEALLKRFYNITGKLPFANRQF